MTFLQTFQSYSWSEISQKIHTKTHADVELALARPGSRNLEDFMALISPAAENYLGAMAEISHKLTQQRFGKTLQMYIPMYLSNECKNICTYCGFSQNNKIPRTTLNEDQILTEIAAIKSFGFKHILLVSGEDSAHVGMEYFKKVLKIIAPHFSHISMEVQPLEQKEYEVLIALKLNTVLVYQETYGPRYAEYHPKGKKAKFNHRLETPDKLGKAGIHKIGLGALIGLDDWRADSWFTGLHLSYLEKNYWRTKFSISFPRLRPAQGVINPKNPIEDKELVQLICAWRIFNSDVELSLSTRESPEFRDNIIKLGITSLSAGSHTEPGGYASDTKALEQFEIHDSRSPQEVVTMISKNGYEAVWKDWDHCYSITSNPP